MSRLALILLLFIAACAPASGVSPDSVLSAFKSAGLEAEVVPGERDASLPLGCESVRFRVGTDGKAGRVFVCASPVDAERVAGYPRAGHKSSTFPADWVFSKGSAVVTLDGTLPEATAKRYEAALP